MLEQKSIILDGKSYSEEILEKIALEIKKTNLKPKLATILVGDNPSSHTYVQMKIRTCKKVGIISEYIHLPENTTTENLLKTIQKLNQDSSIHGILLQHPCPSQIDERKCFDTISSRKDVDGVTSESFGKLSMGVPTFFPCTPLGIIFLLQKYNIDTTGKDAVVIGRSPILGKPIAMMLNELNATVTICHSKTKNLDKVIKNSQIIVAALGKPNFVKENWLKENVILIDAGYNEGNIGDIDLKNCKKKSSYYTPVPGGVGPMTISMLLLQTLYSAKEQFLTITDKIWK